MKISDFKWLMWFFFKLNNMITSAKSLVQYYLSEAIMFRPNKNTCIDILYNVADMIRKCMEDINAVCQHCFYFPYVIPREQILYADVIISFEFINNSYSCLLAIHYEQWSSGCKHISGLSDHIPGLSSVLLWTLLIFLAKKLTWYCFAPPRCKRRWYNKSERSP